ncbi:NAD-dependent epimerase/dehydratase family protein [Gemmatimonadota bacterium]
MRALVTGATGFLGSHLVERLASEGIETICLVLPGDDLHWIGDLDVEIIEGDCTEKDSLRPALDRAPDLIFHLAGIANAPTADVYQQVNALGTRNLVELCLERELALDRFVFSSSASVMGPSNGKAPWTEADDCHPTTLYGQSKVAAEQHVRELEGHIPYTIIRVALIYGPRATHGFSMMLRMAVKGFLPSTMQLRSNVIHVEDVTRCLLHVARHDAAVDRTYLLGSEDPMSLAEIANMIDDALDRRILRVRIPFLMLYPIALTYQVMGHLRGRVPQIDLRRLEDMRHRDWLIDSSRIRNETGFVPEIDLETGLRQTVEWFRQAVEKP